MSVIRSFSHLGRHAFSASVGLFVSSSVWRLSVRHSAICKYVRLLVCQSVSLSAYMSLLPNNFVKFVYHFASLSVHQSIRLYICCPFFKYLAIFVLLDSCGQIHLIRLEILDPLVNSNFIILS